MSDWGRASREAAHRLVQSAIDRNLVPGDRQASEPEMLAETGVSRGTLREALRLLNFLGTSEGRAGPGRGTVIARPGTSAATSSLAMILQSRRSTAGDVLEAVGAIAPAAAALAARARTDRSASRLRDAVDALDHASADEFWSAYVRSQIALASSSGNEVYAVTLTALLEILAVYPVEFPRRERGRLVNDAREVLDDVIDGDANLASTVTAAGHARTIAWVRRNKPEAVQTWITWPVVDRWLVQQENAKWP